MLNSSIPLNGLSRATQKFASAETCLASVGGRALPQRAAKGRTGVREDKPERSLGKAHVIQKASSPKVELAVKLDPTGQLLSFIAFINCVLGQFSGPERKR